MSELTDEVCRLIEQANEEERRIILAYLRERVPLHSIEAEWRTTAEEILTAIARSSDLTLRGIRGILAEAIFEKRLLPELERNGWGAIKIVGDQSYDFLIERGEAQVRIQVKLQRKEKGAPKEYTHRSRASLKCPPRTVYVVEVQKTRSGVKNGEKTRPYRFGDFDILAVNLQPATGSWERFAFTVGSWLLPRAKEPNLIEIFQPVSIVPDEYWTDDLSTCIEWFLGGTEKRLYS
ncbi:MAG: hypothetical protein ABSF98_20760 [Bryobacteraceae bacterium]|jgi:hypothetical protein